jgi:hypothetical protein
MQSVINEEYNMFLEDINNPAFIFGRYMNETEYEDEYGNNDIKTAIEELAEKIRLYLHENIPNKFIVSTGWCVHVMTPDRARQSRISERTIEEYLVK